MLKLLARNPAKILGEEKLGILKPGARADVVLLDLDYKYTYQNTKVQSAARNTPFIGRKFQGIVHTTIANGTVIYRKS